MYHFREEIHEGINNYFIKFIYDNMNNCIESSDSDGRLSNHYFDNDNRLIKTIYKSGFIKTWKHEKGSSLYKDSNGVEFYTENENNSVQRAFHGTTLSNYKKVRKQGFAKKPSLWAQSTGNVFVFSNFGYYTDSHCKQMAEKYAYHAASLLDDKPVVIELNITDLKLKKVSVDYYDPSYEILDKVLPNNIISVIKLLNNT